MSRHKKSYRTKNIESEPPEPPHPPWELPPKNGTAPSAYPVKGRYARPSSKNSSNNSRKGSRSHSLSSSKSTVSSEILEAIPVLDLKPGLSSTDGKYSYSLEESPTKFNRSPSTRDKTQHVSDTDDLSLSKTTTVAVETTDHKKSYHAKKPSDAALSDVQTTPVTEHNIDATTNTVVRLPNDFVQRTRELHIQNPEPDSGGWFTSTDKTYQFVIVMQLGRPYLWDRFTNERKPVDELLSTYFRRQTLSKSKLRPDHLDSGYVTRSATFFTVGKVFSILFTEPCNDPTRNRFSPNVSTVMLGEKVWSQITRFVVVQDGRGLCYACPILTYGGRGTTKPGCCPEEHAIAYMRGSRPTLLEGEQGITKSPIEITPANEDTKVLDPASRIRFGRGQAIQHNVRAKEIGEVVDDHKNMLVTHWKQEICAGSEDEWVALSKMMDATESKDAAAGVEDVEKEILHSASTPNELSNGTAPRRETININGYEYVIISEVGGQLHSGFEPVRKPKSFFKRGRVFMVFWPELAGLPETERTIYWKIRRFVVIRPKASYCLCFSINTYQGQGTTKAGIAVHDHAAVVPVGGEMLLHPIEKALTKPPIVIKIEDASISIDPMSRINFAKVYTVEYNLKVRKIGLVAPDSIKKMEDYFLEVLRSTS